MSDLPSWGLFTLWDTSSVLTTWQLGTHGKWSKRARRKSQCSRVICVIIQVGLTRPGRDNLGHEYHGAGSLVSMWGADHAPYNWGTSSFSTSSHFQCVDTRRISEMCWSWWHGTSFRAMDYLHQPVLERPHSSLTADAHIMTRNLLTCRGIWTAWWLVNTTVLPRSWGNLLSHRHLIPSALFLCVFFFFFFYCFGGCEMDFLIFIWIFKVTNKTY